MSYASLNKNVFKCFLKVSKLGAILIANGSLFYLDGPAAVSVTLKSPSKVFSSKDVLKYQKSDFLLIHISQNVILDFKQGSLSRRKTTIS